VSAVLLAGCVVPRPKSCLNPKPHSWFNLRSEGDERIWRVTAYDEDEIGGLDTPAVGDALSVVGALDIHAAEDSQGRRRIAYCVQVWAEPFTPLRLSKMFDLHADPLRLGNWPWLCPGGGPGAKFPKTFMEYPPAQRSGRKAG
jgi:hypothetical protein